MKNKFKLFLIIESGFAGKKEQKNNLKLCQKSTNYNTFFVSCRNPLITIQFLDLEISSGGENSNNLNLLRIKKSNLQSKNNLICSYRIIIFIIF